MCSLLRRQLVALSTPEFAASWEFRPETSTAEAIWTSKSNATPARRGAMWCHKPDSRQRIRTWVRTTHTVEVSWKGRQSLNSCRLCEESVRMPSETKSNRRLNHGQAESSSNRTPCWRLSNLGFKQMSSGHGCKTCKTSVVLKDAERC